MHNYDRLVLFINNKLWSNKLEDAFVMMLNIMHAKQRYFRRAQGTTALFLYANDKQISVVVFKCNNNSASHTFQNVTLHPRNVSLLESFLLQTH